jgi:phosphoserine phosphatase
MYVWHSEARLKQLEQDFAHWFRGHVPRFPVVQARLTSYLDANDADIWLITGSPQTLVEQVYFDTLATARESYRHANCPRLRRLGADDALPGA